MLWGKLQIGLFSGSFLYILGLFKTKVQNGNVSGDHKISSVFFLFRGGGGGGGMPDIPFFLFLFFFFFCGGGVNIRYWVQVYA